MWSCWPSQPLWGPQPPAFWCEDDYQDEEPQKIRRGDAIPDAGLVIFEGRSHFAFIEEWQRFLLIVKAFFKEEEGK
ncbi:MAG: hypothetical protein RSC98_01280 [Clostridia bacterium]